MTDYGTGCGRADSTASGNRRTPVESGTDWTLDADGLLTITSDEGFKDLKLKHPYGWSSNTSAVTSIFIDETVTTILGICCFLWFAVLVVIVMDTSTFGCFFALLNRFIFLLIYFIIQKRSGFL